MFSRRIFKFQTLRNPLRNFFKAPNRRNTKLIASSPKKQHISLLLCHRTPNERFLSTIQELDVVDSNTFEKVCEDTLNTLADYFEELVESEQKLAKADVIYGSGVLTIDLGNYGTYVINRQSPNKQIWLSSPTSGPKRFDYLIKENCWIYKHDGQILHDLLKKEFEKIVGRELSIPQ